MVLRWRPGELSPINIPRDRVFSGSPTSWTWLSHLRGSGSTPVQSTKTLQIEQCRRIGGGGEGRKQKDKQNPKTSGKSKTKQTKTHKETHTHTHTENKKAESNQTNNQTPK